MPAPDPRFVLCTLGFSALAGMRSLSPPALLSLYLARHQALFEPEIVKQLHSTVVRTTLVGLAFGEIIADKLPNAPDRVFAPAVIFRALTGGGVSAVLWSLHKHSAWLGGILGAVAAIAATYSTFRFRLWMGRILPGSYAVSWSGLLEDVVIWLGGWRLLRSEEG